MEHEQIEETAPAEQSPVVEAPQAAPEKAEEPEAEPKARSRREALEKAFSDVDSGDKPEPKKAEAKPEPKEADKAEDDGQPRGPDGKFAAKEAKPEEAEKETDEGEKKPISEAPSRFSADAKAAWKDAPEAVRGEINRAMSEMERGIEQYRQVVEPLKPFLQLAQQNRVDPAQTIERYVQVDQAFSRDPRAGFEMIARNMGTNLNDLIQRITGEAADVPERDSVISGLQNEIQQLKTQLVQVGQSVQQQRTSSVEQQVNAFAAEHPRFEELAPEIQRLLETGYASDLKSAYEYAERLNPAPQVADPPQPAPPPAQTREAKSVTGAPSSGSNPVKRKPSNSRTEALERGMRAAGLL